ncbi:PREDICTED: piggyBac transposable element-derived protein 2-like, partial [Dinoponera quadriceps]|uniref:PiggyBac transposable element-derived protein 2-like n=1 Tax=Dinoponera quadriceps TaxID=609295 RepID=A0A6P3XW04_DINQU
MESDDDFEFLRNSRRKKPRILYSSDSEDEFLDAILLNREEHDENTLSQFMCDQQDWSPFITDCVPFKKYNQEYRMLPEIDYDNAFSIYKLFLCDDIIDLMVLETNKYYEKCALQAHSSVTIRKHKQQWKPTTRDEMHIFIGILLIMGVVKVPEIRLYWSKDPMFSNERIKSAMSRERYLDILQYWHFSDGDQVCSNDRLFKINTLVEKINRNFQKVVKPGKELTIDE